MNTAIINVKVNPDLKAQAHSLAEELGFSLSSLINAYLKQLVRTKTVNYSITEEPTGYLLDALKKSKEDTKNNRVSPSFDNSKDAINWLNNPSKRYADKV